jgi:hypothetical protein
MTPSAYNPGPADQLAGGTANGSASPQDLAGQKPRRKKRPDMTWHDHLIMLLHIGASIEHALMVQYLYAAYSLGGEQVPKRYWPMIQRWQENILAVAREEMGHLLTVQNILTLMGAGVNLDRENFPWDIEYYPFPFALEPLTQGSLACYVYAEMPEGEEFDEKELITKLASADARENERGKVFELHAVGEIYSEIMELINDPERIPDSAFQEETILMQASWDDWGRGYQPRPRPLDAEGNLVKLPEDSAAADQFKAAHVMIDQVATRKQAFEALRKLSIQGEGPHRPKDPQAEKSHFERFITIFREFEQIKNAAWKPARPVPRNPTTVETNPGCYISSDNSRDWAELFNLRYRLLLTLLAHTFRLARKARPDEPSIRAVIMHRVFGEMYNLKTLAGILVQQPLSDAGNNGAPKHEVLCAGPPFEMPYNLRLPPGEADTWCLYLDILGSVNNLCTIILSKNPRPEHRAYVETLVDLDGRTQAWLNRVLAGLSSRERY